MSGAPEGFTYRHRRNGDLELLHHGRTAALLRGSAAARFLVDVESGDSQELMARLTGNYKPPHAAGRRHQITLAWHGTDHAP